MKCNESVCANVNSGKGLIIIVKRERKVVGIHGIVGGTGNQIGNIGRYRKPLKSHVLGIGPGHPFRGRRSFIGKQNLIIEDENTYDPKP